jgi:hypothetical protein
MADCSRVERLIEEAIKTGKVAKNVVEVAGGERHVVKRMIVKNKL